MGSDERRGGIDDDQHLLTRIAEGDQTALRALVVAYRPRLWRYLGTQLGDCPELIEEVLQDVLVAIWRAAAGFRGEARVATWLYRLAHHHAANARRSASRHGVASYLDDADEGDERSPLITASHDDAVAERLDLHAALRSLPVKQREAIELVFVQGFSCGGGRAHRVGTHRNYRELAEPRAPRALRVLDGVHQTGESVEWLTYPRWSAPPPAI